MMIENEGFGERLSRSRRQSWWLAAAMYTGSAVIAGTLARKLLLAPDVGAGLSQAALVAWIAIAVIGFTAGCLLYLRAMDEVEIRDNLVGGIGGLYVYVIGFPTWWLLWRGGAAPAPNAWVIYLSSLGVAALVYIWRRTLGTLGR